jgi:hypothetical protein
MATLALTACTEATPAGYRAASTAIVEAEQFRSAANDCQRSAGSQSSPSTACTQAIALYEKIRSTPTHFADDSEWKRFSEPYNAGTNLMFMGFLKDVCLPETGTGLSARIKSICAMSMQAKADAWKKLRS